MNQNSVDPNLRPTRFIDSDHPAVRAFVDEVVGATRDERERAVRLYYAVRDGFRYDPYGVDLGDRSLTASTVLELGRGWCVTKAALLAAVCRAAGIPARVGYADVKNHLSTERLRQAMKTDVFHWHGYTSILLDGAWRKATPAFNIELCTRFRLKPLEFDGREDSINHAYDEAGNRHMEYLQFRGEFDDVPVATIRSDFARLYPDFKEMNHGADFSADAEAENAAAP
jgi:transglutaminase-like putative cysteine protease